MYNKNISNYEIEIIESVIENYKDFITIKRYGKHSKQEDIIDIIEYKIDGEIIVLIEKKI